MLYQKSLIGREPYYILKENASGFQEHRHPELELSFCTDGFYDVFIDKKSYRVSRGDLAVIPPMTAHEFSESGKHTGKRITIEVGAGFLSGYFAPFKSLRSIPPVLSLLNAEEPVLRELSDLLTETADLAENRTAFSPLFIKSALYKISALLLSFLTEKGYTRVSKRFVGDAAKIKKSFEMIYDGYKGKLDLDAVCKECGYSKSSFCRVFKAVTGDTFHSALNAYRVEAACSELEDTSLPVETVAENAGFTDSKSFCRVFKKIMGVSPGEYRKRHG